MNFSVHAALFIKNPKGIFIMPTPNDEFPYILEKTRLALMKKSFWHIATRIIAKYFPMDPFDRPDITKIDTFDIDLQKMKFEDPDLHKQVVQLLTSNCDMLFNAYRTEENVKQANSLIDYSNMVSQTSDVGKYFR